MTVYTNYTASAQTTDYATQNALQLYADATYQGALDKVLSLVGRGRRTLATMSKTHTAVDNGSREAVRVPLQAFAAAPTVAALTISTLSFGRCRHAHKTAGCQLPSLEIRWLL